MADKTKKTPEVAIEETSLVVENMTTMARITRAITPEQWNVIKQTVAPSLNEPELRLFLYRSNKLGLDPLNGEIFAYSAGNGTDRKMVVIVARDGKRVVAERSGRLKSIKSEAIYRKKVIITPAAEKTAEVAEYKRCEPWEGGELWGATCVVLRKDTDEPFTVTVPLAEYKMQKAIWTQKPETMIKKVAESQALSQAFPEMSGVYDESERWDEPKTSGAIIAPEEADKPATDAQKENLRNLVGYEKMSVEDKDFWDDQFVTMTYAQAVAKTREVATAKK